MLKRVTAAGSAATHYKTAYTLFKGVDLSSDSTKVDITRSPYALNMVADGGGFPEKRVGWRTVAQTEAPVNGMFYTVAGGKSRIIVHGGTRLYELAEGEAVEIYSGISSNSSTGFTLAGKLWILTKGEYLCYDGKEVCDALKAAYVPTTVISRAPSGGGESYEEINMLTPKQKNSFLADGVSKIYSLNRERLDEAAVSATVNGVEKTEGKDFTVNRTTGKVTFISAPQKPEVTGQDNVVIAFEKTAEGYQDRIRKCGIAALYGVGTNDRVFVSGNSEYRNYDWYSGLSDPSYFPDLNYSVVGSDNTAIMGYHKIGESLAIIKEDNANDSTVFLRTADIADAGRGEQAVFPLKQGITGVGAISPKGLATLQDEPLFLARTGIYGIASSNITYEKALQNRSYFVNSRLTAEEGLEKACSAEWNGMLLTAVNGNCYVLNGRQQKSYTANSYGEYVYECYHWDNIPAVCFLEQGGRLYFGTADGRVCRFNNDIGGTARFNDDGQPIRCRFCTKADDDGDFMRLKTLQKRGCGIMIKPYARSSCRVYLRTNGDFGRQIKSAKMDTFNFNDIDFTRLTFNTNDSPQVIPFNTRVKKYVTAQFIVENNELNEGFGVFGVIKRFTMGGYVKK